MSMQDLFAEAVERLIAGEPAASIVASYPAELQGEISELLAIVELADHMAVQPAPAHSPAQHQRARADFLQQAQTLRSEMEQALDAAEQAGTPTLPADAGPERQQAGAVRSHPAGWWNQLRTAWRNFFDAPVLRLAPLAPLAAIVVAIYLAMFWTVQSAKAALPGDPAYPLKQWVRQQRITLASPEQRPGAVREAEEEIAAEARTMLAQPRVRDYLNMEYSEPLVYYGRQGNLLLFGPFMVAPNFQPDPVEEVFVAMRIRGDLDPGARVELVYRMLPGNPNVVQGVSATVIESPKPTPLPTPAPTVEPTCRRQLPSGWIPYALRAGDSLESLAERSGVSITSIIRVNCLEDGTPAGAGTIYLPDSIIVRVTPPAMPSPLPTYTPWPTPTPEPVATEPTATPAPPTAQPTSTAVPGVTEPAATEPAETEPPETATLEPTPLEPTPLEPTPIGTPTVELTAEPTGELTVEPTIEPTIETTIEPTVELTAEPTGELTVEPTVDPTIETTIEPTVELTAEPTGELTVEPTAAPATVTPDATPLPIEPAPTSTEPVATGPAATRTPVRVPTATDAPVELPTQEPTRVSMPTAIPTAIPTQPPPTPEPPPPTQPPPTQPPPTAEPPAPIPPAEETQEGG